MRKTFMNMIYNGIYQLLILLLPIITVPYVSSRLGKTALGVNAYVNAVPVFLSVIILFGMNQYGARTIAQAHRKNLGEKFAQLWLIQLIVGIITILAFIVIVLLALDHKGYFLLEIPFLIGYVLDVSWFFIGLGEIKRVVTRNTIIKLLILASIFIFVHKPSDLWIYLLINSVTYLANVIFWFDLHRYFNVRQAFKHPSWNKKYFWGALNVTLPSIAVQFYVSFDQNIVGKLAGYVQLAYYQQSQMICRAMLTMIGSVSTVLMPKMAEMLTFRNGDKRVNHMMGTVLDYTLMIGMFFTAAFMVNAKKFVVWFWTKDFAPMAPVLFISAIIIVVVSYGSVYANQYTLSKGFFKRYSFPFYVGAVVSVSLNFLIVPKYKAIGGAVTIVITELLVCFLRIWVVRKELPIWHYFANEWKTILAGILSVIIGLFLPINLGSLFIDLVLQTMILTLVYFSILLLLRENSVINLIQRIRNFRHTN